MSKHENAIDNKARLSRFGRDIRSYGRDNGSDDFSEVVQGALIAENATNKAVVGSGYPRKGQ
ncbi:hypothetical protein [Streptomyces sp. NPDC021622]|uniref:hypothetical protein n=1 Tax=Streptomyces sp. NPDC021622 TaxID=3155013 RepID=UPI0033C79804